MTWSASKIFTAYVTDVINRTSTLDANTNVITCALYSNTPTPDQAVASANSCYGAGQWITSGTQGANEVYETGQWAQGGVNLTGVTSGFSANVYTFSANPTASGAAADLSGVFGCLVYDNSTTSPADQGMCYNYFGGGAQVVNGTFTVVWSGSGIFALTL